VRPVLDHVVWLVPDAQATLAELRIKHGLGHRRSMYYPRAGTQHYTVPLQPPAYFEVLEIVNRDDAASGDVGPQVLACEARGYGLFAWAVLVDDVEPVAARLGLPIDDYTLAQPDGTLRGWRTVDGADHLPFFIDYPNNGNRAERLDIQYAEAEHTSAPSHFTALHLEGDKDELDAWLGPHDLPLHYRPGDRGIYAAEIATADGIVRIPAAVRR
jgi:hypothetical protein